MSSSPYRRVTIEIAGPGFINITLESASQASVVMEILTLGKKYGFSDQFIDAVKMLYNDIKADILVNGFRSVIIRIGRCVKQGDALSCALFILCLDPLIRNIERNKEIKAIEITTPLSNKKINSKTGGFADDVGIITANCETAIREVFLEYERFSIRSGVRLNETKTEIMVLSSPAPVFNPIKFRVVLPNRSFELESVRSITICGIMYSNYPEVAYEFNVLKKIEKLKNKLLAWQFRGLSLGGKITVTNTFGISQLIYSMQVCEYFNSDLRELERFIFGFLWSKNLNVTTAPDRIKRSIMKQDYDNGGLRIPDIKALNDALKLKQFFRASNSGHVIKLIQRYRLESIGYDYVINQEYSKICPHDIVISTAQVTINSLTDKWRKQNTLNIEEVEGLLDLVASIDVKEYLKRKKALLVGCLFERVFRSGIEKFKQLVMENSYPRSDNFKKLTSLILKEFPAIWVNEVQNNIEVNQYLDVREKFYVQGPTLLPVNSYTVKFLRKCLTFESQDNFKFNRKLGITQHEGINPFLTARLVNYATSQRIFKFRLLHLDIFTKDRMFKFKMVNTDKCDICGVTETIVHAIWECPRAKSVWNSFRNLLRGAGLPDSLELINLFVGYNPTNQVIETMITKLTQSLLSYDRSTYITEAKCKNIVNNFAFLNKTYEHKYKNSVHLLIWDKILETCSAV